MSGIVKILRSFWAIWGALIYGSTILIQLPLAFVCFEVFKEKGVRFMIWLGLTIHSWIVLTLCGIIVLNRGKEQVPKDKAYVIVSNHRSQLDILVNAATTPVLFKYLSKAEVTKIPVLGYFVRKGCITIDRSSRSSKNAGFSAMEKTIRDQFSVLIYPEGTRNRTQEPLKNMYNGAFRLAILTQTPILVTTLIGTDKLSNPNRKLDFSPGIVRTYWAPPISTEGMTEDDIPRLREQVQEIMLSNLTTGTSA